jgi:hypothetical protein
MLHKYGWFTKILVVRGLKRSGNHAIIEWIGACSSTVLINNAFPVGTGSKKGNGEFQFPCRLGTKIGIRHLFRRVLLGKTTLLISVEDRGVAQPLFFEDDLIEHVLVIRDPINLFSSRIKKAFSTPNKVAYANSRNAQFDRAMELWKEHCREAINVTTNLKNRVVIYFDRWVSDSGYRQRVYGELGLKGIFVEPHTTISSFGGGSSFGDQVRDEQTLLNRKHLLSSKELELLSHIERDGELMSLRQLLIQHFSRASVGSL